MMTNLYGLRNSIPNSTEFGALFYVGVGSANRLRSHWRHGRKASHHNPLVQDVLSEHVAHNVIPGQEILVVCPSHEYAFELEAKYIESLGRKRLGTGLLCNIAKGGDGPDSELMSDPAIRKKISAASKANWAKPESREKQSKIMRSVGKTESFKKAVSEQTKVALNNPTTRAKHLAALGKVNEDLSKESRSASQKKSYEDNPERRVKVSKWAKESNLDPAMRRRRSVAVTAANLNSWSDPLIRAKRIAGMQGKKKTMSAAALNARRLNLLKRKSLALQ